MLRNNVTIIAVAGLTSVYYSVGMSKIVPHDVRLSARLVGYW